MDRLQWRKERRLWNEAQTDVFMHGNMTNAEEATSIPPIATCWNASWICVHGRISSRRGVWDRKILAFPFSTRMLVVWDGSLAANAALCSSQVPRNSCQSSEVAGAFSR